MLWRRSECSFYRYVWLPKSRRYDRLAIDRYSRRSLRKKRQILKRLLSTPDCRISNSESEELDITGNLHYFLNNVSGVVENGYIVRAWGTQTDITELKRAQQASKDAETAVLEERNRLAREIHDTLAQAFTGVSLHLEAAKSIFTRDSAKTRQHIDRAGTLARRGLSEARRSVLALRSRALETDTLPNALRTALQEMTGETASDTALHTEFILTGTLPPPRRHPNQPPAHRPRSDYQYASSCTGEYPYPHADLCTRASAAGDRRQRLRLRNHPPHRSRRLRPARHVRAHHLLWRPLLLHQRPKAGTVIDIVIPT